MINALTIFVFSWLWRKAGEGGFKHALWIRKIVIPYIAYILTHNLAFSIFVIIGSTREITYKDDEITPQNTWWLWVVGAIYGLGVSLLYKNVILCATSFIVVMSVFACGVMVVEYTKDQYAEDIQPAFELVFGALLGLSVILS